VNAAYQLEEAQSNFDKARSVLEEVARTLKSPEARAWTHFDVELHLSDKGKEIMRLMFQGHLDVLKDSEQPVKVVGVEGVARNTIRRYSLRRLRTIFGEVEVCRTLYQAPGLPACAPQDGSLALGDDSVYSMGLCRLVAEESARCSYDETVASILRNTGELLPKRQVEQMAVDATLDFEAFYQQQKWQVEVDSMLLVLTFDGAGIIMRWQGLRPGTLKKAQAENGEPKRWPSRTASGKKENRKRMAEVGAVYSVSPHIRSANDIMGEMSSIRSADHPYLNQNRPRPINKRVFASVERPFHEVIDEGFADAQRRDPQHLRPWIVLVDGDPKQIAAIQAAAARWGVQVTIICDCIHVLEYLWHAAHCLYKAGSTDAQEWVTARFRGLLEGEDPSAMAAGMCRSATNRRLEANKRQAIDDCARYLIHHKNQLDYATALAKGYPIATGVIEGACRHIVRDRLDCCGARWLVKGAEAILKLRCLRSSGDLDAYWKYHLQQEFKRNHEAKYADQCVPNPFSGQSRLRLVR
jgi:hypothetical protein